MSAGRVKRDLRVVRRPGRPALPRWPELHPRYHNPAKLRGIDKYAYELATKGDDGKGGNAI